MKTSEISVGETLAYRITQRVFQGSSYLIPWKKTKVFQGEEPFKQAVNELREKGIKKPLIVSDETLYQLGLLDSFFQVLKENEIDFALYKDVQPNPTTRTIEHGYHEYKKNQCDCLISIGGGSVIDCAKAIGIRVVKPRKKLIQFKGILKVRKKLPLHLAIPTTAGTGSEVTIATVITDEKTHHKYPISDPCLAADIAVLDPVLTKGLPPHLTATTGMDALTHAIEAYIGRSNTSNTKQYSKDAVKLIGAYLPKAYHEPANLEARGKMLEASFLAGKAFTRAYIGYVHALAHAIGGMYGLAHGYTNAILLPVVLETYQDSAEKPLSELADTLGLNGDSNAEKTKELIAWIVSMNKEFNIPETISEIKEEDMSQIVENAILEAHPFYPVPCLFQKETLMGILKKVRG